MIRLINSVLEFILNQLGTTKNWATASVGRCLTMRKSLLERDCPGQQIFLGEEGAIFRDAQLIDHNPIVNHGLKSTTPRSPVKQ